MNVADIAVHRPAELRRVGIEYPDRIRIMSDAIRIYRSFGIACDISEDNVLSYPVPRPAALFYAGLIERFTGLVAFNEWL